MRYKSKDGLCESSNPEFVATWNNVVEEQRIKETKWVEDLRSQGVKAAHPDDGWVNRKEDSVLLCYPQFNDGVEVGDTIALGWAWDDTRLVKVTDIIVLPFGNPRYKFEPMEIEVEEKKMNWWTRLFNWTKEEELK